MGLDPKDSALVRITPVYAERGELKERGDGAVRILRVQHSKDLAITASDVLEDLCWIAKH
jgi:hypothetical protein